MPKQMSARWITNVKAIAVRAYLLFAGIENAKNSCKLQNTSEPSVSLERNFKYSYYSARCKELER